MQASEISSNKIFCSSLGKTSKSMDKKEYFVKLTTRNVVFGSDKCVVADGWKLITGGVS
jgi:hypothetical protein